mmetsp:Transcript_13807/g.18022  ORF Transcript_13807/g.18022 Transcript_13807/m.18022 type:complete len:148 (-) Transcript_13807:145-588(-)
MSDADADADAHADADADVDLQLSDVIVESFSSFHGFHPKLWQLQTCQHLLRSVLTGPPGAVPILLCRPTGGGKSAVRDCTSYVMGGGVCLTVVPLLALAGDQTTKLRKVAETQDDVRVYNLDEIKSSKNKRLLMKSLIDDSEVDVWD